MNPLDRAGLRSLILLIAFAPMVVGTLATVRLATLSEQGRQEALAELSDLDRLLAFRDFESNLMAESGFYGGWNAAFGSLEDDAGSLSILIARNAFTETLQGATDRARLSVDGVNLSTGERALLDRFDSLLVEVREQFAAESDPDLPDELEAIDALRTEWIARTDAIAVGRSLDWSVIDLQSRFSGRTSAELSVVVTLLMSGESDESQRQQAAVLISQTDEAFGQLLAVVTPQQRIELEEAFDNVYTTQIRTMVASLGESFEPLSLDVLATGADDLERFSGSGEAIRAQSAEDVRASAQARADNATSERNLMIAVAVLALLVPGLLVVGVGGRINRRLRSLTEAAAAISKGELAISVDVGGTDELALLAKTFTEVSETVSLGHDQISALADGRLSDPVLDRPMPGPAGRTLRSAIRRLGTTTAELAHQASHDRLTGLLDRSGFHLAEASLAAGQERAALLIDLDGFKLVNDTYGHAAGDEVLTVIARRLEAEVRDGDLVARLGGDEFVIVTDGEGVESTVARIHERLVEPIRWEGHTVVVSGSIGCTVIGPAESFGAALGRADIAMYRAKRESLGRNAHTGSGEAAVWEVEHGLV